MIIFVWGELWQEADMTAGVVWAPSLQTAREVLPVCCEAEAPTEYQNQALAFERDIITQFQYLVMVHKISNLPMNKEQLSKISIILDTNICVQHFKLCYAKRSSRSVLPFHFSTPALGAILFRRYEV